MWMPHQVKELELNSLGLRMNAEDLYREDGTGLMNAVVNIGYATGGFVSSNGLILTNHHIVSGVLQRASKDDNYLKNGFIATSLKDEIPAQGYIADVLLGYEEVTDKILSGIMPEMSYRQRYDVIDKAGKELIAEGEKEGSDIYCKVVSIYSGNKYYLFKYKRLKDIRLVCAPPDDIGDFGGETDNWMWPRHACDFAFLRAYVSEDNTGVEYNPDNKPYKPGSIMKISMDGVREGDFTFVAGYPGKTYRNYTLPEIVFDMDLLKRRMEMLKDAYEFFENADKDYKGIETKYAGKIKGLHNSLKNYRGKLEGIEKVSLIRKKKAIEKEFLEWIKQDAGREKKYGDILAKIANFMNRYSDVYWKNLILSRLKSSYSGARLISQGYLVYKIVEERQKPDTERERMYQEKNLYRLETRIRLAERGYDLSTDKALFKFQLKSLFEQPDNKIPSALKHIIEQKSEKAVDDYVDSMYEKTILADVEQRLKLIDMKPDELMKLDDPVINLAAQLEKEIGVLRVEDEAIDQERLELKKTYMEALLIQKEGKIAPDANRTIRFTYGSVEGYSPRDTVYYNPLTTLKGVMEKDKGEIPFNVPEKLKTLYKERDFGPYIDKQLNDVPACFLTTTNITRGSSGSPVFNAKGELVGVIFDMIYESVIGDYYVVPELQRAISVDIRYILFIVEKFLGAEHLLKEMNL